MIYLISDKNKHRVKIGYSINLEKRLKTIQTGNPIDLVLLKTYLGKKEDEKYLHENLQQYKIKGEWYTYNIIKHIIPRYLPSKSKYKIEKEFLLYLKKNNISREIKKRLTYTEMYNILNILRKYFTKNKDSYFIDYYNMLLNKLNNENIILFDSNHIIYNNINNTKHLYKNIKWFFVKVNLVLEHKN